MKLTHFGHITTHVMHFTLFQSYLYAQFGHIDPENTRAYLALSYVYGILGHEHTR